MTALTEFVGRILPDVPGCPRTTIISAALDGAIELCKRAEVHKYEHAAIATTASTASYAFVPPAGTVVAEVLRAWYDGNEIDPQDQDQLNDLYVDWLNESGTPKYFTRLDKRNIRLVPTPDATGSLTLLVSLKPAIDATTIDDTVYQEYRELIESYAKAKLMAMSDKSWTNYQLAAALMGKFEDEIPGVQFKAGKGHVRARRRTKAQFF